MLRCSVPVRCAFTVSTAGSTSTSTELQFRRVFSSQSTVLDLIPVKKPVIEGSLSWLLLDCFELVLVSGVKGTSSDEVAESVKQRAVSLLANCGGGDALKGSQIIRQSVLQLTNLRSFMHKLDLSVRLVLSQSSCSSEKLCCAVYASDPWEPHRWESYLTDVISSHSLQTVEQVIQAALLVVLQEAKAKSRQLLQDTIKETRLALRTAPSELVPSTLAEGPPLIPAPRYEVDIEFVRLHEEREMQNGSYTCIAASWVLRDDAENAERCDVPLVPLRDARGLLHRSRRPGPPPMDAAFLAQRAAAGAVTRVRAVDGSESLRGALRSLWRQPLLHARLLRASAPLFPPRAEDFAASCGRAAVSAWLRAQKRPAHVPPPLPLLSGAGAPGAFLRAGLRHELGSRAEAPAEAGPLRLFFAAAATPRGCVATPVGGFVSAAAALSALLPWHKSLPPAPPRGNGSAAEERHIAGAASSLGPTASSTAETGISAEEPLWDALRVIDMEKTLRRMGVAAGELSEGVLTYRDASGRQLLRFEEMNNLTGIERFVRRVRRSKEPCFLTVRLAKGSRNFRALLVKAFGENTMQKSPPYVKNFRVAAPLVPGNYFSLRVKDSYSRDFVMYRLLNILHQYSEDPSEWQLRLQAPCFFNVFKMTRSIIHAITLEDPTFRYTVEHQLEVPRRVTAGGMNSGNNGETTPFVLRFFSGEVMTSETILKKNYELADACQYFTEYAVKQGCRVTSVLNTVFPPQSISEGFSATYKGFVASILGNGEVFVQKTDEVRLEVQITQNVHFILARSTDVTMSRESLCMMFVRQQFPSFLPMVELFARVHRIVSTGKKMQFKCINIPGSYRWEFVEGDKVVEDLSGRSHLDVLTDLVGNIERRLGDIPESTIVRDNSVSSNLSPIFNGSIAYYQDLFAKKHGIPEVFHEYDAKKRILTIKGITHTQKHVVFRTLHLDNEIHIMDILHRYYRWLLRVSPPQSRQKDAFLAVGPLTVIYSRCQPFFSTPLPPLEESLRMVQLPKTWSAELSLPGPLFGFDTVVKRCFYAKSKNEARRKAVCTLYKTLYDPISPAHQCLFEKRCEVSLAAAPEESIGRGNGSASMISDLERIVINRLRRHTGYDGVIEYNFSHMTGITGRFVPHLTDDEKEYDPVELFHRYFNPNELPPLQVLEALVTCACQLMPKGDMRDELFFASSSWPSVFTHVERSERLFCTTSLRRYMGLWTFEANDVEEARVSAPGTLYLVERTSYVAATVVEASLVIVQTPLKPRTNKFRKTLASHRSYEEETAISGMWRNVAQHFTPLQSLEKRENMDVALLNSVSGSDR